MVLLSAMPNLTFIPTSGPLDLIFHKSWLAINVFGAATGGYKVTFIALIILVIIALGDNAITERLTSRKAGVLILAALITVMGAALVQDDVHLWCEIALER